MCVCALSCTKESIIENEIKLTAAFAPDPCQHLEPAYALINIDDKEYSFEVERSLGGVLSTTSIYLSNGEYQISNLRIYDINGQLLFWTLPYEPSGRIVVPESYTMKINTDTTLVAQIFCK